MDAALIALASRSGGDLRKLLYAFFSFLHRRTDFYLVPNEDDIKEGIAKMGFREGDAEKLLLAAFRQFPLRRIPRQPGIQKTPKVSGTSTKGVNAKEESEKKSPPPKSGGHSSAETQTAQSSSVPISCKSSEEISPPDASHEVRLSEKGLQIPVGNGGSTKRYKWTQTIDECSVLLGVPEGFRGKDLSVEMKASSVSVCSKKPLEDKSDSRVFLEGSLVERIIPSESTWSLEGGVLVLILYKQKKTFWATVIEGDEKIDTSLVDSRRHIGEYDEATQAQIRKIMFDQSQERKGLPTSGQLSRTKPQIPALPPGVEYIDQVTLDERTKDSKK